MTGIRAVIPLFLLVCIANILSFVEGNNIPQIPAAKFTPGPEITLDRLYTIDPTHLASPPSFIGGDCTISPSPLVPNGTVTVVLPPPMDGNNNNTDSLETIVVDTLKVSLPYLLEQIGVEPEHIPKLVDRGIPLFRDGIGELFRLDPTGGLSRRGFLDGVLGFFEDALGLAREAALNALCSGVAAGLLPVYIGTAIWVFQHNTQTPRPSTPNQDFFIFPLHGSISHDDGISISYDSNLPNVFGETFGITFGTRVFLKSSFEATNADFTTPTNLFNFHVLLHEFTHSKQYQSVHYNLAAFGTQYIFNLCKAGSYNGNVMEADAFTKQTLVDELITNPFGKQFFTIWKASNLGPTLGLPTARNPTLLFGVGDIRILRLPMQRGRMVIACIGTSCALS